MSKANIPHLLEIAEYSKTHSYRDTMTKFKCSMNTIYRARKRFGVEESATNKKLSDDKKVQIVALSKKAIPVSEIAKICNVARVTAKKVIEENLPYIEQKKIKKKIRSNAMTKVHEKRKQPFVWVPPSLAAGQHDVFRGIPI